MLKLYGIANCATVKKARVWLTEQGIEAEFHDFKKLGLNETTAQNWLQQQDWARLINRSGTTWRQLSDQEKQAVQDAPSALALMLQKHSVIKRPILELDGRVLYLGFDAAAYQQILKENNV